MKASIATNVPVDSDPISVFLEAGAATPAGEDRLYIPSWGRSEWENLFAHTTAVDLEASEVLIQQDQADRALFFVVSGKLEVAVISHTDNSLMPIRVISPGSLVGELAFFDGGPRSAKAWAVTRSRLLRLGVADYEDYRSTHLAEASALLFAMARLLAVRLRNTTARL